MGPPKPSSFPSNPHQIKIPPNARIWTWSATALGASMWFFLFYRARQDGAVFLGLKHPWDH